MSDDPKSRAAVLATLQGLLSNFQGREYSGPMGEDTLFFADLGLASIDAVVLGEELQAHYGQDLNYGEMMADLGQRAERDLSLGELATFVSRHLHRPS